VTTNDTPELAGRVAVVTGAGSGLGAAIARACGGVGMAVAVLDIDEPRAREVSSELEGRGVRTLAARIDVGEPASVADATARVEEWSGGCDVLFANVGVQQFGSIDRLTEDDWAWVIGVNVLGTVRTVASFLPAMRRRTGWRRIVVTASSGVFVTGVRLGAYTTSKAAVTGFAETLREELAEEGIGVTVVFPAGMSTRHLESSALARPENLGSSVTNPDDIQAMLSSRGAAITDVVTPEDAIRGLLSDLVAGEPYFMTHGSYRSAYQERLAALDRAFERMENRGSASTG
jgi:NAD(P)-dependent dehydrogenase (short-subunit alcohol dehydrogenase family)